MRLISTERVQRFTSQQQHVRLIANLSHSDTNLMKMEWEQNEFCTNIQRSHNWCSKVPPFALILAQWRARRRFMDAVSVNIVNKYLRRRTDVNCYRYQNSNNFFMEIKAI